MNLQKHIKNNLLRIKVRPNSSRTELVEEKGAGEESALKLYLKAVPDKNKANKELIKFFKKRFDLDVTIKSGLTSREKVLKVE